MKRKILICFLMSILCVNMVGCGAVTKVSAAEISNVEVDLTEEKQEESVTDILIRVALTSAIDNALEKAKQEITEMKGEIN